MIKMKIFLKELHQKKPCLEPIFISVSTTLLGFMINMYTAFLSKEPPEPFWRTYYLWIILVLLSIIILYYIFLSPYSSRRNNEIIDKEDGKKMLLAEYVATECRCIKDGNIETSRASTEIYKTAKWAIDEK